MNILPIRLLENVTGLEGIEAMAWLTYPNFNAITRVTHITCLCIFYLISGQNGRNVSLICCHFTLSLTHWHAFTAVRRQTRGKTVYL
jgi:hypothetical protein